MTVSNLKNLLDDYNQDYTIRPITIVVCFYSKFQLRWYKHGVNKKTDLIG